MCSTICFHGTKSSRLKIVFELVLCISSLHLDKRLGLVFAGEVVFGLGLGVRNRIKLRDQACGVGQVSGV